MVDFVEAMLLKISPKSLSQDRFVEASGPFLHCTLTVKLEVKELLVDTTRGHRLASQVHHLVAFQTFQVASY